MRPFWGCTGFLLVFLAGNAMAGSIQIANAPSSPALSLVGHTYSCPTASCVLSTTELASQLGLADVTVVASSGTVTASDPLTWAAATRLTLVAATDIHVDAALTAAAGAITLRADGACVQHGTTVAAAASLAASEVTAYNHENADTVLASAMAGGTLTSFLLADTSAELAAIGTTGNWALGCDVVDTGGYVPIATFGGTFDGLGHAVVDLLVNVTGNAGVFALLDSATVRNLVVVRPTVTSQTASAGGLAGTVNASTVANVAVIDASITGAAGTGGVIGTVTISDVSRLYVSGVVNGTTEAGGAVGRMDGSVLPGTPSTLAEVMSRTRVNGTTNVGGLAGALAKNAPLSPATASRSWAAGRVTGTTNVGGAVGSAGLGGSASNVYWDTDTTQVATSAGGTGRAHTAMLDQASFGGFDFATIWSIRQGVGRPFLRSMQTLLDVALAVTGNSTTTVTETASFTATVTQAPSYRAPTGVVRFLDGTTALGTVALASGSAPLSTTALAVGAHTIRAVFDGSDYQIENAGSVSHTVNAGTTTTTIDNAEGPIVATVNAQPPATGIPTGNVVFKVDGVDGAPVSLVGGVANLDPSSLGAGTHTVSAAFTSDDGSFGASSSTSIQVSVVGPTTTTLDSSSDTTHLGESVTLTATVSSSEGAPTGTVRFVADGTNILSEVALTAGSAQTSVSSLSAGDHLLVAKYIPADSNFTASVSPSVLHSVSKAVSTTAVTTSQSDGMVSATMTVAPAIAGQPTPTGQVFLFIDGTQVAQPNLAAGSATFTSAQLTHGLHTVSARYDGDINYDGSTSPQVNVDVVLDGFRLSAAPPRASLFPGGTASFVLTLTPEGPSFDQPVTLTCGELPVGGTCHFGQETLIVKNNGTKVGLVVSTQRPVLAPASVGTPHDGPREAALLVTFIAAFMALSRGRLRRYAPALAVALVCLSCKSEKAATFTPVAGTPPGLYTVTVTATAGALTRTATLEVEVLEGE